jgi:hypothetical protein
MDAMNTIYFDSKLTDAERRRELYRGQLFAYSPTPSGIALCEHARQMCEEAFAPHDPPTAQHHMPAEEYAAVLAELKPKFIHHPNSKEHIQGLLGELGCDLEQTYFDVPRLRTATSDDYLTAGIAYAFHPHRDTWYSAPFCQVNWWLPVYPVKSDNVMAFHTRYWDQPVKNGSRDYNYYEWNKTSRKEAAKHVKKDTRKQPKPEEPMELDPQVRVVTEVGGVLLFSGAQMHSTVPNTTGETRFSIDFRVVNLEDAAERAGAPNVDSECTGTTMRDYLRGTDFSHVPEEIVELWDDETRNRGELVYEPTGAGGSSG